MIDVLLPFYGDPGLMRVAVRSVLAQTSDAWRLVVVDDGYPDPSVSTWFAGIDDPRVEYRRNATNLGANANYTRALGLAKAEHVVVMGADDVMHPRYLAVVEEALVAVPDAAVVQCGVEVIDGHGTPVTPLVDRVKGLLRPRGTEVLGLKGDRLMSSLLHGNWTYFPSLCWRRDVVVGIGFRPQFHVVQDLALLMDVLAQGGTMALAPEVAFSYRRHSGSDSAVKTVGGARFGEERAYFALIAGELEALGHHRAACAARAHLTSRLHAAALVPGVMLRRQLPDARRLLAHVTQ